MSGVTETDIKTSAGRSCVFRDPETIRGMARRAGALNSRTITTGLEYAVNEGRGGLYLDLIPEQYARWTDDHKDAHLPLRATIQESVALAHEVYCPFFRIVPETMREKW